LIGEESRLSNTDENDDVRLPHVVVSSISDLGGELSSSPVRYEFTVEGRL
jgi:hypothetical protein